MGPPGTHEKYRVSKDVENGLPNTQQLDGGEKQSRLRQNKARDLRKLAGQRLGMEMHAL